MNNTTAHIKSEQDILQLPLYVLALLFYALLFITALISFSDIYLPLQGRADDFQFKGFFVHNYLLKVVLYLLKFTGYFFLFQAVLYVGRVKVGHGSVLKAIIVAEMLFFIPDLAEIFWYYGFCGECTLEGWEAINRAFYPINWITDGSKGIPASIAEAIGLLEIAYVAAISSLIAHIAGQKIGRMAVLLGTAYFACQIVWELIYWGFTN